MRMKKNLQFNSLEKNHPCTHQLKNTQRKKTNRKLRTDYLPCCDGKQTVLINTDTSWSLANDAVIAMNDDNFVTALGSDPDQCTTHRNSQNPSAEPITFSRLGHQVYTTI